MRVLESGDLECGSEREVERAQGDDEKPVTALQSGQAVPGRGAEQQSRGEAVAEKDDQADRHFLACKLHGDVAAGPHGLGYDEQKPVAKMHE